MTQNLQPDERFVEQVRQFLANLYNYPELQTQPLVETLAPQGGDAVQRMRAVRAMVLETLQRMNPGPNVPFRAARARAHAILQLRYVEGLGVREVASELATSERTLYRELRQAVQELALLLWEQQSVGARRLGTGAVLKGQVLFPPSASLHPPQDALVLEEAQRIAGEAQGVAIAGLLGGAVAAVTRLATHCRVHLNCPAIDPSWVVHTEPRLARQALISALSCCIQNAAPETRLSIAVHPTASGLNLKIAYQGSPPTPSEPSARAAQQLVERLGGRWSVGKRGPKHARVELSFGAPQSLLLVIDDNEGLPQLFHRYLDGEGYLIVHAASGDDGLRMAQELLPDVIVLDVMMPASDGWEVLERFQALERIGNIPVIICSVLNDPQLALSLGAAAFLPKPVDRTLLLRTLASLQPHSRSRFDQAQPAGSR